MHVDICVFRLCYDLEATAGVYKELKTAHDFVVIFIIYNVHVLWQYALNFVCLQ